MRESNRMHVDLTISIQWMLTVFGVHVCRHLAMHICAFISAINKINDIMLIQ